MAVYLKTSFWSISMFNLLPIFPFDRQHGAKGLNLYKIMGWFYPYFLKSQVESKCCVVQIFEHSLMLICIECVCK